MRFENVALLGVAHAEPPHRVTSEAIEDRLSPMRERLGLPAGMLKSLTGVLARRMWDEGTQPSEAATFAAERVLQKTGVAASRVGLLVNTSVCRDFLEPSTASLVHGRLGFSTHSRNFDLGNACLGFLDGLDLASMWIERGAADYAIVVDGESSRFVLDQTIERLNAPTSTKDDFRDNFATLTLGSGAAAFLLTNVHLHPTATRYHGGISRAATQHNGLCRGQADGMVTDGPALLREGVALAKRTWQAAVDELSWSHDRFDHLVMHQVSRMHTQQVTKAMGLPLDRVHRFYPEWGNVGPAAIPIGLSILAETGVLGAGDRIALMGIGSGLNLSMAEVTWGAGTR